MWVRPKMFPIATLKAEKNKAYFDVLIILFLRKVNLDEGKVKFNIDIQKLGILYIVISNDILFICKMCIK